MKYPVIFLTTLLLACSPMKGRDAKDCGYCNKAKKNCAAAEKHEKGSCGEKAKSGCCGKKR